MTITKTKLVFDVLIALPVKAAWAIEELGQEPQKLPNGNHCIILDEFRAGVIAEEDSPEARLKAARTAIFFFKKEHPDYAGSFLVPHSMTLVRTSLVA